MQHWILLIIYQHRFVYIYTHIQSCLHIYICIVCKRMQTCCPWRICDKSIWVFGPATPDNISNHANVGPISTNPGLSLSLSYIYTHSPPLVSFLPRILTRNHPLLYLPINDKAVVCVLQLRNQSLSLSLFSSSHTLTAAFLALVSHAIYVRTQRESFSLFVLLLLLFVFLYHQQSVHLYTHICLCLSFVNWPFSHTRLYIYWYSVYIYVQRETIGTAIIGWYTSRLYSNIRMHSTNYICICLLSLLPPTLNSPVPELHVLTYICIYRYTTFTTNIVHDSVWFMSRRVIPVNTTYIVSICSIY